jgi:uncharacterized membrane protein
MDAEHEKRFGGIEARLARLETLLAAMATGRSPQARPQSAPPPGPPAISSPEPSREPPPEPTPTATAPASERAATTDGSLSSHRPAGAHAAPREEYVLHDDEPPREREPLRRHEPPHHDETRPALATSILGWGGAIALVLAAAYLIRLAIDTGWLTPLRQVGLAALAGLALIGAGLALRGVNRAYAGLLPAAGIVVLFLSVYGGHLYYGFLSAPAAAVAVVGICVVSLWLCRVFESDLYALFAVAGSYSAPFLLSTLRGSAVDLVIYFSAWNVVFSAFAIWQGRRLVYLLALYLALISFDLLSSNLAQSDWHVGVAFQTVQLAIFGIATVAFSIRNQRPLDETAAFAHLPPLLLFYFIQYAQLSSHVPAAAPWIAVGSLAVVALLYGVARVALKRPLPGGEFLLWAYVAVVLGHAGYVESVPKPWAPWVALGLVPIAAIATVQFRLKLERCWPVWAAIAAIFVVNYLRIAFDTDVVAVPGKTALALAYAALLYAGYAFLGQRDKDGAIKLLLLYAGHISAMAAALHFFDVHIVQSAAWGVLALACLAVSLARHDRLLGQSSLLVFAATAGKVLLYDLSGAHPVARIVSLVVLGVTFYFGGLLYQKMLGAEG